MYIFIFLKLYIFVFLLLGRFLKLELLRHHANACLHLHHGSGLLAASPSRNSLGIRRRSRGQWGAGRACQTRDSIGAVDRGPIWTWELHMWSSEGLPTPDWQVLYYFSCVLFLVVTVNPGLSLQYSTLKLSSHHLNSIRDSWGCG